jgi:ubiquitin carboxyl-terminal hydrolase L3
MVPRPVKAVILLFPAKGTIEVRRLEDDTRIAKDGQHPIDPSLVYIEQTVSLCALYMHARRYTSYTLRSKMPVEQSACFML